MEPIVEKGVFAIVADARAAAATSQSLQRVPRHAGVEGIARSAIGIRRNSTIVTR